MFPNLRNTDSGIVSSLARAMSVMLSAISVLRHSAFFLFIQKLPGAAVRFANYLGLCSSGCDCSRVEILKPLLGGISVIKPGNFASFPCIPSRLGKHVASFSWVLSLQATLNSNTLHGLQQLSSTSKSSTEGLSTEPCGLKLERSQTCLWRKLGCC